MSIIPAHLLDQKGKCVCFTTLELGFHQIEIDLEDIPKAAFNVANGQCEFLRMLLSTTVSDKYPLPIIPGLLDQ